VHIENKNAASIETCEPELAAIVGKSAVVRFVPALDGRAADDFTVARRAGFYIDSDKFVRAIAETFDAKRPNIDELLLTLDAGEVR